MSTRAPQVSVVIPAYRSEATLAGCLRGLERQRFRDFETIVVDSSPDERTAEVARDFPWIAFDRSSERLLPQAARNRGASDSRGALLVFTDPDTYAWPDWLERLVASHRDNGHPLVGALACHGDRPLDLAIHLCKFSKWLPAGEPRPVDVSPSANMLVSRELFHDVGGFPADSMQGDAELSWELRRRGRTLWFEPRAVVEHHHLETAASYLRERHQRGRELAGLRLDWAGATRRHAFLWLLLTALPLRLASNLAWVARHSSRADQLATFARLFPLVAAGFVAFLSGEARCYAARTLAGTLSTAPVQGRSSVSS